VFKLAKKNAGQILKEFTASPFRDPKKVVAMFAEDGAFEMPYLDSLGFPWRYEGREKIEGFFKCVRDLYPDMEFHDVKVVCETPDVVVGEYEFTTRSSKTGRVIHQLFVGRLEAENGQIKLLRESINLVELGLAIYTNGLADYKAPRERQI
jgi:ketosteroid isomerase-like protein